MLRYLPVLVLAGCSGPAATPGSIKLAVREQPCRAAIDGRDVALTALEGELRRLPSGSQLDFADMPAASFDCVDRVLIIVNRVPGFRMSFVGNELSKGNTQ